MAQDRLHHRTRQYVGAPVYASSALAQGRKTHLRIRLLPPCAQLCEHLVGRNPSRARVPEPLAHDRADVAHERCAEVQADVGPGQGRFGRVGCGRVLFRGCGRGRRRCGGGNVEGRVACCRVDCRLCRRRGRGHRRAGRVEALDLLLLLPADRDQVADLVPAIVGLVDTERGRRWEGLVEVAGRCGRECRVLLEQELANGEGQVEIGFIDRGLLCERCEGSGA